MEANVRRAAIGFLTLVGALAIVGVAAFALYRVLAKPVMPVTVTFDRATATEFLPDMGYVARLANTSGRFLAMKATMENKTVQQTMTSVVELPPEANATNLVPAGPAQGWNLVLGETLKLSHEDYQDLAVGCREGGRCVRVCASQVVVTTIAGAARASGA